MPGESSENPSFRITLTGMDGEYSVRAIGLGRPLP